MRWLIVTLAAMICTSCSEPDAATMTETRISVWQIDPEPTLTIGGDDEAEPLYRITSAARTSRGILIATRGNRELRLYGDDGSLRARIGRDGQGPGEFRNPEIVGRLPADSIVVHDALNRRLSIICEGSRICTEIPLSGPGRAVGIVGDRIVITYAPPAPPAPGRKRSIHYFMTTLRDGRGIDTLEILEGAAAGARSSGNNIYVIPVFLTRSPVARATAGHLLLANGLDPVIRDYTPVAWTPDTIRLPMQVQRVAKEEFDSLADAFARGASSTDQPGLADLVRLVEPPEIRPSFRRLLVDGADGIWIELDERGVRDRNWLVTDMRGRPQARVQSLPGFEVLDVGRSEVIGLWRDSLDVEYVRVHALRR